MMATNRVLARPVLVPRDGQPEVATDADLARALIRGDTSVAEQAWARFAPSVRATIRRLVGPGVDEDDLSQEVFLRFFSRVGTLREPEAVRSFLFGICLRVARKEVRRRWLKRWLRITEDGVLPEPNINLAASDLARETRDAIARYYRLLDDLGAESRSLFVTRHIEGLELAEVARLHGISLSTTQRRLGRIEKRVDAMMRRDPTLAEFADAPPGADDSRSEEEAES
jgi:RNA polymerase sigma-70 factor (ECF subfamily)